LVAHRASGFNLEIELKNIILRRVSIFEFLHSQGQKQTHALQQAGLFDHLVGSQQYGGGHRWYVDGSASGAPQDVAGTTARDPVPPKSCPSYRQR
jgi:hypothetical protein